VNPGIYDDLPDADYHADPALSSSGARKLLPPSCPARFHWERENGQPPRAAFDFGKAAHGEVLGTGGEIVVVTADDWRTKAAKELREATYAEGKIPLLPDEARQVQEMAAALQEHPIASALLDPDHGRPEVSLFWDDDRYGVARRARLDWLPGASGGRLIIPDYKTCQSAEPRSFAKSMANYGYHAQADWYLEAVRALGLADDAAFVLIAQEKTPPYLVTVFEPDAEALRVGRVMNDRALQVFADCTATDTWPGYAADDEIPLIGLPAWATYTFGVSA
jgi:hypothetical protein